MLLLIFASSFCSQVDLHIFNIIIIKSRIELLRVSRFKNRLRNRGCIEMKFERKLHDKCFLDRLSAPFEEAECYVQNDSANNNNNNETPIQGRLKINHPVDARRGDIRRGNEVAN